jgi:hypothetical protein
MSDWADEIADKLASTDMEWEIAVALRAARNKALDEAAEAMRPMLRSMISRNWAYETIIALKEPKP